MGGLTASEREAAWTLLKARWADEEAHRAFLDRAGDLESLAEAGARYKRALDDSPGDAVAARWRDEVVTRAAAIALFRPPRNPPRRVPGLLFLGLALAFLVAATWALLRAAHRAGVR